MTQYCLDALKVRTADRLRRMEKQIRAIERHYENDDHEQTYRDFAGLIRQAELMARESRDSVIELYNGLGSLGLAPPGRVLPGLPGLEISEADGIYRIQMDTLLPFCGHGYVHWLHEGLDRSLTKWRDENSLPSPLIPGRAVLLFRHHFDKHFPRHVKDYDNLELRCLINTLSLHFLWGDSPDCYMLMQMAVKAERSYTEVLLMDMEKFLELTAQNKLDLR